MKRFRGLLTSSNTLALIALFVALGGTAGAAGIKLITGADIKNGSITGADIEPGSLSGNELRRGAVTGTEIRNGSLHLRDFSPNSLRQLYARTNGSTGATGPQGPAGTPATLQSIRTAGADISNYPDRHPIVTATADAPGYYLAIASGTVANTGAIDDYLNCGFDVAGAIAGAAGFSTTAGSTTAGSSVTLVPTTSPNQTVAFVCTATGVTTFDITNIKMQLIRLADQ